MRLTQFSDFSLRLMIYAATHHPRLVTIEEASLAFGISRNHMMKVANHLTRANYLTAVRGRSGGLRLARPAGNIFVGQIVRSTEADFAMVECFGNGDQCRITRACRLKGILGTALRAFMAELDRHSLADIVVDPALFDMDMVAANQA